MRGFTLIEMMIVCALIAIVASFAVPAFQDKIRKARRADGIAALSGLQQSMEKFRGNCAFFPSGLASSDTCGTNSAGTSIKYPSTSGGGYYTLSISGTSSGNSYTILADPIGAQVADTDCDPMNIVVDNSNPKGLKGPTSPTNCW